MTFAALDGAIHVLFLHGSVGVIADPLAKIFPDVNIRRDLDQQKLVLYSAMLPTCYTQRAV